MRHFSYAPFALWLGPYYAVCVHPPFRLLSSFFAGRSAEGKLRLPPRHSSSPLKESHRLLRNSHMGYRACLSSLRHLSELFWTKSRMMFTLRFAADDIVSHSVRRSAPRDGCHATNEMYSLTRRFGLTSCVFIKDEAHLRGLQQMDHKIRGSNEDMRDNWSRAVRRGEDVLFHE